MISTIEDFRFPFFMGVAGTGMSAIAQYLQGSGKQVSGSDRFFVPGQPNEIRDKLEAEGIHCFPQDGQGITSETDLVVISTAVEESVPELKLAREKGITVIKRAELLAIIAASRKTIAVGGTSGKSTTSAMLFDVLEEAGLKPGVIGGAGLISLIRKGKIGNAMVGEGDWLIIEADESDGSIVLYKPEIGLLLNVDKDHKEMDVLMDVFTSFKNNSKFFSVNKSHPLAATLSVNNENDFSWKADHVAGYMATGFEQEGMKISFQVNDVPFHLNLVGRHNMENALAAATIASMAGVPLQTAAVALSRYEGIYRRHQLLGKKNDVWVIDDFAHNPVKCAAAIEACQAIAPKVIAWFQPHGYGPTKFLRADFVDEIGKVLRDNDEIWMSEIFYAGGTALKDISSNDLIDDLRAIGKKAFFVEDRNHLLETLRPHLEGPSVLLLMGARDPSLEQFAKGVWEKL